MATLSNPVFYYNQATQASGSAAGYVGWGGTSSGLTGGNCTRIVRYTLTTGVNDSASSITIKMLTDSGSGTLSWKEGTSNITSDTVLTSMINDKIDLYFIIGTSATEHIKAGRDYVSSGKYTGKVHLNPYYTASSGHSLSTLRFHAQLDGEYTLAPNKTYYVWIFPGYAYADGTYGVFRWDDGVTSSNFRYQILLDGVPEGAVYIDSGSAFEPYQIYIDNGSSWDLYQAYIDNGSSWDLCGR